MTRRGFTPAPGGGTIPSEHLVVAGTEVSTLHTDDTWLVPGGAWTKCEQFPTEFLDVNGDFASNRYTASETQLVWVCCMCRRSSMGNTDYFSVAAVVNGSEYHLLGGGMQTKATTPATYDYNCIGRDMYAAPLFLESGDYVDIYVYADIGPRLDSFLMFVIPLGASAIQFAVEGDTTGLPMALIDCTNAETTHDQTGDSFVKSVMEKESSVLLCTPGLTFDETNNRLTCVTAGTYRAFACARLNDVAGGSVTELEIRKNGTMALEATHDAGAGWLMGHAEGEIELAVDDYVEHWVQQDTTKQNIDRRESLLMLVKEP